MAVIVDELPHAAFTMLRNCWLRDGRVSYKAKGLLGYLRSHAAGYKCSQAQMVRDSDDGRAAVRAALDELDAAGYLERIPTRDGGRYAETDYRMRDPFDPMGQILPGMPKTSAAVAAGVQKIVQGRKSDMVTVSEKPTREIAPIEDQGEKTTPAPTEQGAGGDGRRLRAVDGPTVAQRANALTREHYDAVGGLVSFPGVAAMLRRALAATRPDGSPWYTDDEIRKALATLRATGRPAFRIEDLRKALADPRSLAPRTGTSNGYRPAPSGPYRNPDPAAHPDAFTGAF